MTQKPDQEGKRNEPSVLEADDPLVDMAIAVDQAFPNLKCLRCGNEGFYLLGAAVEGFGGQAVDLVCRRCGMVERHSCKILKDAAKPIIVD